MAPLVEAFPASELQSRINNLPTGKRRKSPVDLENCELKELSQYFCNLNGAEEDPRSKVVCQEFVRSFRKYVVMISFCLGDNENLGIV